MLRSIAITASLLFGSTLIAKDSLPMTAEAVEQVIESLDWRGTGTYKLPSSNASLSVPAEHLVLIGKDAEKLSNLIGNTSDASLEAITVDDSFRNTVYFFNHDEGYVSLDDWEKINPEQLLSSIRENTEKGNKERRKKGIGEIHILGWIQEPALDKHTHTVYWSIEQEEDGEDENSFNSVALRLGRRGFESVVWVGDVSDYKSFGGELDVMLRAHSFEPGYRYSDHTVGDKVAGYGIASLVAATVGAKIIKAGGLAIMFKKIGGFLIAGVSAVFYKMRKGFGRKKKEDSSND